MKTNPHQKSYFADVAAAFALTFVVLAFAPDAVEAFVADAVATPGFDMPLAAGAFEVEPDVFELADDSAFDTAVSGVEASDVTAAFEVAVAPAFKLPVVALVATCEIEVGFVELAGPTLAAAWGAFWLWVDAPGETLAPWISKHPVGRMDCMVEDPAAAKYASMLGRTLTQRFWLIALTCACASSGPFCIMEARVSTTA